MDEGRRRTRQDEADTPFLISAAKFDFRRNARLPVARRSRI